MPNSVRKIYSGKLAGLRAGASAVAAFCAGVILFQLPANVVPAAESDANSPASARKPKDKSPGGAGATKPAAPATQENAPLPTPEPTPEPSKDPAQEPPVAPPLLMEPDVLPEPPPSETQRERATSRPVLPAGNLYQPAWRASLPVAPPDESPEGPLIQYSVPNFYGRAPQQIAIAAGKNITYGGSLRLGYSYDDNPNPQSTQGSNGSGSGSGRNSETKSDLTTGLSAYFTLQTGNEQRLLLLDWRGDLSYYWQRKQNEFEYNTGLNLTYTHRFFSPAMLSANVSVAYLSQPDYSQIGLQNQSKDNSESGYFVADAKVDYSYRFHPQFTTRTSLSLHTVDYPKEEDSNWSVTLGNEARFHSDFLVWIGEVRYQDTEYFKSSERNSTSLFLLAGAEYNWGSEFQTSLRVGGVLRNSDTTGNSSAPYGEFSIAYRPDLRNTISLQARYGYEEATSSNESIAARLGLTYARTFGRRLSASLSSNIIQTDEQGGQSDNSSLLFDTSLSLRYRFTKRFSISSQFSYTNNDSSGDSPNQNPDYTRTRFTLTANYEF